MKKLAFSLLILHSILISCTNEPKPTIEVLHIESEKCSNCPEITIAIPKMIQDTRIAKIINKSIEKELIYTLNFEEENEVKTLDHAMQSFTKSYQGLQKQFNDEDISWEAKIKGMVSYEDINIISIKLDTYVFTGGAHGYNTITFLNFDKQKAVQLHTIDLFDDIDGFVELSEIAFKKQEKIPLNNTINNTGFMFNENLFALPKNIGYTKNGIQLIYNPYEIASYADGTIELLISFKKANPFLKENYTIAN